MADWFKIHNAFLTLVGRRVRVDDQYNGTILGVYSGPLEIFFMVDIGDKMLFIDTSDPTRLLVDAPQQLTKD